MKIAKLECHWKIMAAWFRLSTEDDFLSLLASADVICNITIYIDDTTPYCKCGQAADLW